MTTRHSRLAIVLCSLWIAAAGAACREVAPQADAASEPKPADKTPARSGVVTLDEAQLQQVRLEELSTKAPDDAIKATGMVEFDGDRTAKLLPPVPGQVQSLSVRVGDAVHKDDVLFVLSSREVAAAVADHLAAHKDVELAEKTHARTQDLFEHQAASRMALEQSEAELGKARSKALQAEESLQAIGLDPHADGDTIRINSHIAVRAPIDGTVIERTVTNGQFIGAETSPLLTIADLSSVWVQAEVFERDLRHIAVGQKADVSTPAYPDRFSAKVSRIASVVDPQTRTAKVLFQVANPGGRLKPGMFTSVSLYVHDAAPASLTIPAKALFVEEGKTFAYVQTDSREFARRQVEAVPIGADRLRVVQGVTAGDHVVSDGVLLLRQLEANASIR
jgi:cobalt-zinc-cadmium efflux system membrane fusion protein